MANRVETLDTDRAADLATGLRQAAEVVRAYGSNGRRAPLAHQIAAELHLIAVEIECDVRKVMSIDLADAQALRFIRIGDEVADRDEGGEVIWNLDLASVPVFVPAATRSIQEAAAALAAAAASVSRLGEEARFVLMSDTAPRRRGQIVKAAGRINELAAVLQHQM
ncbi:Uncharacterised protein [Mycobacteroides abscessus subsp. abscessus]|uniref:hypothetical protein n=1 Tax=Mycobacteroides abscessus TaxID=36809 RepID=UPI000929552F|nr:hypothetical protein [Mycobacteroides abscessus]SIJ96799.1 Uncharacterised protein [Mycobacteroides abscessus subsp. abscessus]SLC96235.1 Uncharacterised protein [Mycobacteroides abscessus subsp. massiliense]SLF12999.1 Uncharacterised protein [Mycobacteroides abscessus subsp. massiliense]SLF27160.1 Uncharacterised protein [Mycobacteroides abscessus subsp. massiliense]